ncbi:hypothetical protein H5P33_05585 [Mycolicibacterium arabiense]|nr:hypothetical protein [Mycolicibacterium arabiense]
MNVRRLNRTTLKVVGGLASITAAIAIAGCGDTQHNEPTTSTTPTTSSPAPAPSSAPTSPTEKSLDPSGGNLFTPQVIAPPAPTEPPGVHRHKD